jgi:hypothetical protein
LIHTVMMMMIVIKEKGISKVRNDICYIHGKFAEKIFRAKWVIFG